MHKASELDLKIVSPLWLKVCNEKQVLVSEADFRPSNLEARLMAAKSTEVKNKKRLEPDNKQLKIYEKRN